MADLAPLDIRTLDPDDFDQVADLSAHAFGGPRPDLNQETRAVPPEDTIAAYRGGRLVGTTAVHRFQQWFGGRAIPCGGVAGVIVAPDQRGTGLARQMMAEATGAMRERGEPISALYPTTASLYRSVGYEVAGWWAQRAVPLGELPRPTGDVDWEPVDPFDTVIAEVSAACAAGRDGWIVPPPPFWTAFGHRRTATGATSWTWLGQRAGAPVAAVSYSHAKAERAMFDLEAVLVVGADGPALVDALAFLGANGTTGDRLRTTLPGPLLARHVREASRMPTTEDWPWMLRLVDLPGAIAARGWPAGVEIEAHLSLTAPSHVPDDPTGGRWILRVADGTGSCELGGSGAVGIAVTDLAALYSGHLDPTQLVAEGRLTGADDVAVSGLRAAFAGSPSLPMFF